MMSLSVENQSEIIEAFSSTSRYLGDLLNIDNTYFDGLISQIYVPELQLNKAKSSNTEAASLFIIVINMIFVFSLWCIDWVGAWEGLRFVDFSLSFFGSLYANRIFMCSCIKSSIGT